MPEWAVSDQFLAYVSGQYCKRRNLTWAAQSKEKPSFQDLIATYVDGMELAAEINYDYYRYAEVQQLYKPITLFGRNVAVSQESHALQRKFPEKTAWRSQ